MLITGYNKAQCTRDFYLRQDLKVVSPHYALIRCLEDMGWEVEQRVVELGEDLSKYDDVIVYIHSPRSFSHCLYSGVYAISARPDCIIAAEDWQVDQMVESNRQFRIELVNDAPGTKDPYRQYYFDLYKHATPAEARKYHQNYLDALTLVAAGNNRKLIGAYAGGDMGLTKVGWDTKRIFTFNPNPYNLNRRPDNAFGLNPNIDMSIDPKDKSKSWCFSSLMHGKTRPWAKKLESSLSWEIKYYGSRRGQFKCERLEEPEMCREFMNSWGVMAAAYYHAGCGWWRPRVLQTADAGSILISDPKEARLYSDAHVVDPRKIEGMDTTQLIKLAKDQRDGIYEKHPLVKSATRRELTAVLDAAR